MQNSPPANSKRSWQNDLTLDWSPKSITRGKDAVLSLHISIPQGLHIQASKPSEEFFIPTEVRLDKTEGLEIGNPGYPDPVTLSAAWSEVKLLVYENTITVAIPLRVLPTASPGKRRISGTLRYQGCTHSACLPPKTQSFIIDLNLF